MNENCGFSCGMPESKLIIVKWGNITGLIQNQLDLISLLSQYPTINSLAKVAFTGNYNDLIDRPAVIAGTLQEVTDQGNVTTDSIIIGGLSVKGGGSFTGLVSGIPGSNPSDFATVSQLGSALSLTTTGTTGVATLITNRLNIPNYTYTLPGATISSLGGVIIGANISLSGETIFLNQTDIINSLGFTPYNSTNPNGYISANQQIVLQGDITGTGNTLITTTIRPGLVPSPGGNNTNIQFNNSGVFGGNNLLTWNGSLLFVSGGTQVSSLSSTGTTMVVALSNGLLSTQSLPSGISYTFSTGLTNNNNVVTSNLSTGIVGGQTAIGGTASGNTLILTSTSNSSKGFIKLGTSSAYDETNIFLGIGTISPNSPLTIVQSLTGSTAVSAISITDTWNTSGTPTLIKVSVTNTASNAASALLDIQQDAVSRLKVPVNSSRAIFMSTGLQLLGSTGVAGGIAFTGSPAANTITVSKGFSLINNDSVSTGAQSLIILNTGSGDAPTAGASIGIQITGTFNPTTGTATHASLAINQIFNQTGSASGITRAIYINPTLTAVTDFRALEISVGKTIFAASTTSSTSINIPAGSNPTSPNNGDLWFDGTNVHIRIAGVTKTFTVT